MRILPATFLLAAFAAGPLWARPGAGASFAVRAPNGSAGIGQGRAGLPPLWRGHGSNRDHRHQGRRFHGGAVGYGGWGYAMGVAYGPVSDGYFLDGEAIPTRRGVVYDYDRGYPYEHYREAGSRAFDPPPPRLYQCDMEDGVRVCRR